MHPRTEIRKAAVAALIGQTAAADRVAATRISPWRSGELPAVAVYTDDESSTESQTAPRELVRHVDLVIEAAVKMDEGVDDALDDIAAEIEKAMNADRYLDDCAGETLLTGTRMLESVAGDRPVGVIQLTYDVTYHTQAVDEDSPLADFLEAGITHNLGNVVDPGNEANDEIELEGP